MKELRKLYGWSQEALAKQLSVSRQTVISIEMGTYNPSLPLAFHIARSFEISIENVFIFEEVDQEE
ncbi:helix-turn-helix transcriptional regulator [Geomicrobium sp. JCM 19039]|uniref:helix-turn-helix transcriptional regulator n=1 Tax=Geomicrobium sp. JCM 19039 TaxID=1460636 RepID=UPI00045F19AD|nr:helix-turn-helix transcriptional regulator [Geomicrobium sp. JCM 19039]GAK12308.1 transcriptional regulator, Cro/CI family [Geomicrobium sp. JCM 19039]